MKLELLETDKGIKVPVIDGISLASPRNPSEMFQKYLASHDALHQSILLFIFPPHQFLVDLFSKKYPEKKIILVVPFELLQLFSPSMPNQVIVHEESVLRFISETIDESNYGDILFLDWSASRRVFGKRYDLVIAAFDSRIRETHASLMTRWYFEKRWFLNSCLNLSYPNQVSISRTSGIMVLAASGPSLMGHADWLKKHREKIILASLPSSLKFLDCLDMVPDIVFTSDGGYHADIHLRSYFERKSSKDEFKGIVVAPLRSNLRSLFKFKVSIELLACHGDEIFQGESVNPDLFADRGSVAFTAMDFITKKHLGPIFVLGLDLMNHEHASHVLPHTFDTNPVVEAHRFCPLHSGILTEHYFSNGKSWWASGSLEIYRKWLEAHVSEYGSIKSLLPESGFTDSPRYFKTESNISKEFFDNHHSPDIKSNRKTHFNQVQTIAEKISQDIREFPESMNSPWMKKAFSRECHKYRSSKTPDDISGDDRKSMIHYLGKIRKITCSPST